MEAEVTEDEALKTALEDANLEEKTLKSQE